jgi:hypothetical protein
VTVRACAYADRPRPLRLRRPDACAIAHTGTGPTPSPTIATATTPAPTPTPAATEFPADWREKAAGDDKAFLNSLKRFSSPADAFTALRLMQLRVNSGELRAPPKALPESATEEQVTAWRKEQGLPEKAADYVTGLKLPDGTVPGEADKPLLEAFAKEAFDAGFDQKSFDRVTNWWFRMQDTMTAQRDEADNDHRVESQQKLIERMGADYKPNMAALSAFWRGQPPEIAATVLTARTGDGRVIGDIPEVASFFANLARELDPAATILPPGGDTSATGIANRMHEIEGQMYIDGKQNPGYFGGPLEKEYRQLIAAHVRFSISDPVPQGSHHGLRAGHVLAPRMRSRRSRHQRQPGHVPGRRQWRRDCDDPRRQRPHPGASDNLNQYTATLVEWHDLVERTSFNLFASQGDGRAIMQRTTLKVLNRKRDQDILASSPTPPTPRARRSPPRSRW